MQTPHCTLMLKGDLGQLFQGLHGIPPRPQGFILTATNARSSQNSAQCPNLETGLL